jgi:serine protease inhibitor
MKEPVKTICIKISLKYKGNDTKRKKELNNVLKMVKNNDVFKGERYKLYKLINSYK